MDMMERWDLDDIELPPLNQARIDMVNAIDRCISDLRKQSIEDADIIVRKINGRYVAKVDKKRDLKIEEIFKNRKNGR